MTSPALATEFATTPTRLPTAPAAMQTLTLDETDLVGGGNPVVAFLVGAAIGYLVVKYL